MDFTSLFGDLNIKADNLDLAMDVVPHKDTFFSNEIIALDECVKELKTLELSVRLTKFLIT